MEKGIAQAIYRLRKSHNLTQEEFGKKLGYAQRTVSDWEKGYTEPNVEAIRKIKTTFDISYEELLDD